MKISIIDKYLDFLFELENIISKLECIVNNHRGSLEDKYFDKLILGWNKKKSPRPPRSYL
jgi:hypothetical protein